MKKVIKLHESDIERLVKKIIKEQTAKEKFDIYNTKYGSSIGPGKYTPPTITPSFTMDASLFKNGIDKIDTNSQAFNDGKQKIADTIKKLGGNITIKVEGGASAVGSKEGYDNESLARRRSQNFINAIQKAFPETKFVVSANVGKSTVKNSPEAEKEQYVKLFFPGSMKGGSQMPAVDNTQLVMKPLGQVKRETKKEDGITYVKICHWVPQTSLGSALSSLKSAGGKEI